MPLCPLGIRGIWPLAICHSKYASGKTSEMQNRPHTFDKQE